MEFATPEQNGLNQTGVEKSRWDLRIKDWKIDLEHEGTSIAFSKANFPEIREGENDVAQIPVNNRGFGFSVSIDPTKKNEIRIVLRYDAGVVITKKNESRNELDEAQKQLSKELPPKKKEEINDKIRDLKLINEELQHVQLSRKRKLSCIISLRAGDEDIEIARFGTFPKVKQ